MPCDRLTLSGDPRTLARELRELVPTPESVRGQVTEIIGRVRASGDDALRFYTRQYDTGGTTPSALRVPEAELDTAAARLDGSVRAGLQKAMDNVGRVAEASLTGDRKVEFDGHEVTLREVAVDRAAVYVPGGRAPYPSTVVMGVITARVAGVSEIAVCAPPGANGEVNSAVLGACRLAGATAVYRMGGAQAIAALAYGTETVTPVDVIVGPGNLYVQEAKRQVFGQVGIDGFAGPSDLVVLADGDVDADVLALDLLAQAEHGEGSMVVGISSSGDLIDALAARIAQEPDTEAVTRLVQVADLEQGLVLAESFAPEHLQLVGAGAERLASVVRHAGCVFVGPASGTAFGDYIAGSNHVLPTNGAARFASALSPIHFRRRFTEIRIEDDAAALARAAAPLARAEGFEVHARSMEARIRDNGT
ncbi:MAG TPA: histidinol dehydrogenase [Solirubrobacteraceae bacterium]|jgi:histidinol dehydrogenase|nr:histidinol dehydrogenase [Solirubrobacteraceae bacterium]